METRRTKIICVNGVRIRVSDETYREHLKDERKERLRVLCEQERKERRQGQTIF